MPFVTFTVFKLVYSGLISSEFSHGGTSIGERLIFAFLVGTQYWFAYAIFDLFLVAPLFWVRGGYRLSRGLIALIASYCLVLIVAIFNVQLPEWFQIKEAVFYLPYFAFGAFLHQDGEKVKSWVQNKEKILAIIATAITSGFLIVYLFIPEIRIHPIRFFVAISVGYLLYLFATSLPNDIKALKIISKYSLQIMFFDAFYRVVLFAVMGRIITINIGLAVLIAIPTIALGVLSCMILDRIPYIKILFGLSTQTRVFSE